MFSTNLSQLILTFLPLFSQDDCNALQIAMEAGHKDIGLLIYTNMNFSRGSSPVSTF